MTPKETKAKLIALTYSDLAAEIKAGRIRSMYLLTGDEEYLLAKISSAIRKIVIAAGAGEADAYVSDRNGGGVEPDELKALVYTPPFLSSKRLTVLKNTGLFSGRYPESSDVQKAFVNVFEGVPECTCLIFIEPKVDKRKRLLIDALSANGAFAEINRQTDRELGAWIRGLLKREKILISEDAANSLVERTEKQMIVLEQEIQKIILFCKANNISSVDVETLDWVCLPDLRGSIFKMIDAIGMRKTEEALIIFDKLIAMREAITKIRFLILRHVRHLICAKDLGRADTVIAKLGVMPFVARNLVSQAGMFSIAELLDLYRRCQQSDALVKSGRMEERQSLEWTIFSLDRVSHGR